MSVDRISLGIDVGTSTTVAMISGPGGRVRPLLFESSPLLPSAVFAAPGHGPPDSGPATGLLVGVDAERAGVTGPAGLEPNPKRRIDDGTVLLSGRDVSVVDLIAALLARVGAEARRVAGRTPDEVVLTHPATWAAPRLGVLRAAAGAAGLGPVRFVPEPVAAAVHFTTALGHEVSDGTGLVVYDLGAGTVDVTVLRAAGGRFEVIATGGLDDVGGLDLDAAVVAHAHGFTGADVRQRLDHPVTEADHRARQSLWREARAAKEHLSRHASADLVVPSTDLRVHLTREEFETAARPILDRTVAVTGDVIGRAGLDRRRLAGIFLVGGSSRIPLVATLLHRTLDVRPVAIDHPELVVAEGSLRPVAGPGRPFTVPVPPPATPSWPPPVPETPPARPQPAPRPRPPAWPAALARRRPVQIVAGLLAAVVLLVTIEALSSDGPDPGDPKTSSSPTARVVGARPLGSPLRAHTDNVEAVAYSPDGRTMATAGWDRSVVFWDLLLRRPLGAPSLGPGGHITDIAYSPDGTLLAVVGEDRRVWVFDAIRRQVTGEPMSGHTDLVTEVRFSPDGTTIATASDDNTVRLWDVATRRQSGEPLRHDGWVRGLAFSPDGTALASASYDRLVRVWDLATRTRRHPPMAGHTDAIGDLAWSPAAPLLATVSGDGTLRFWDAAAGKPAGEPVRVGDGWSAVVTFSPDGATVATGSDDNLVRLWDVQRRERIGEPLRAHDDAIGDVAFDPAGEGLATVSNDRTVQVWTVLD